MLGNGNYLPGFNNALTPMEIVHTRMDYRIFIYSNLNTLHETKDATKSSALVSDK